MPASPGGTHHQSLDLPELTAAHLSPSLLSQEQVLALAPDPSAAKAGQGLAAARHWQGLGRSALALWGQCQGSALYQTRVDLSDLASKCSCPSRKFPCKHALGLLLLYAQSGVGSGTEQPPAWVDEWLFQRGARAEKKSEQTAVAQTPEAQRTAAQQTEKRAARRDTRIGAGLDELKRWIEDLLEAGLAQAPVKDAGFWEARARRLVDAQAPGAARSLRAMHGLCFHADWPVRLLTELALLHLLCESWSRLDTLPAPLRASVERAVGIPQRSEDLADLPAVTDDWRVLGHVVEELERVRALRTWLLGQGSGLPALLLSFQPLHLPPPVGLPLDSCWRGALHFHPGAVPQRAEFLCPPERVALASTWRDGHFGPVRAALAAAGARRAADPWCRLHALPVRGALCRLADSPGFGLRDAEGHCLPLTGDPAHQWHWYARSLGADWDWLVELEADRDYRLLRGWPLDGWTETQAA